MGREMCWCLQDCSHRAHCLSGLLCFVAGIAIVVLHYFNPDLLKTFFDLHEVRTEDCQEMTEVYINPQFMSNTQSPPQPSRIISSGM